MDLDVSGELGHLFHLVVTCPVLPFAARVAIPAPDATLLRIMTQMLLIPEDSSLQHLADLATKGRAVLMTCERAKADLVRKQVDNYLAQRGAKPSYRFGLERVWARPN